MQVMKDSGVSWIGEIPLRWDVYRNKDGFINTKTIVGENSKNTPLLSLTTKGIKLKDIDNPEGKQPESFDTYQCVEVNDLVMCLFDLDISAVFSGLSSYNGMISPAYKVLKCNERVIAKYADYWFRYIFDGRKFNQYAKNIRYTLTYDVFSALPMLYPPVEEQQYIVNYLDTKCAQIDTIIAKEQSVIEKLQEYKQAIITQAITRGLNSSTKMKKIGLEWIGMVPEHWDVKRIKYLTSKIGSGKTPKGGSDVYTDEGVLFIRSQNVYDGYFDLSSIAFISHDIDSTMSNTRVYRNDVLLNITGGSIGRSCLYESDEPANVNQHVCIIRCNNQMRPKFMQYFWNSRIGKISIDIYQSGANREGLNFTEIGNTLVPTPELHEQDQIIDYLDGKCGVINNVIRQKHSLINKLTEYKKSLIYEVVTGKKEVPHV